MEVFMRGLKGITIVAAILMLALTQAVGQSRDVDASTFSLIQTPWQNANSYTFPTWISDAGDVVGGYQAGPTDTQHGFVKVRDCRRGQDPRLDSICGKVFTIDGPASANASTVLLGIDAFGNILGSYYDGALFHIALWYPQCTRKHCSLDFHTFDDPNEVPSGIDPGTFPIGISRDGTITGTYRASGGGTGVFVAHPDHSNWQASPEITALTFSDIDIPGYTANPEAISNNGLIAGSVTGVGPGLTPWGGSVTDYGSFLRRRDGRVTVVDVQESGIPIITALNSFGTAVGILGAPDSPEEGYIGKPDGTVTYLFPCGPTGINDKGVVVGNVAYQTDAFLRTPDGTVTYLNAPGTTSSQGTTVQGINNAGWIIGYVWGSSGNQPFVWKPL